MEANQLVEMTDVTARLQGVTKGLSGAAFNTALKAEMSGSKGSAPPDRRLRCDVVTLFNGSKYHYKYRRFQDVPGLRARVLHGRLRRDADNFHFPRFGYDAAFLRVWDANGQPLKTAATCPGRGRGEGGRPVAVSGHPGATERQSTVAELEFQRDVALPFTLLYLAELRACCASTPRRERWRTTRAKLRSVENGLKALRGRHQALAEPSLLASKRKAEAGCGEGGGGRS